MAYIDTEKLKRNIRVNLMPNVDIDGTVTVENAERYFLNLIDKTSTVDVAEVKHGHWIPHKIMIRSPYARNYYCSECGNSPIECGAYCNKCGAKMDGGEN